MDFFAQQENARRLTRLMAGMFVLAVICIVLTINLTGALIYIHFSDIPVFPPMAALRAVPHSAYWITTAIVLGVIAWGTLTRMYELSGGGGAVALMVGARRVKRDSADAGERRLLNIVEEMAIAAGISVPQVYIMDDQPGINAFAAGYSPNEAAVTVTRGTLEQLDRDELQGVVAHEFSHILNGDMRLNVRLIGIIAGIVMIGGIGRFLMRMGGSRADGNIVTDQRRGDMRLFLLGLVVWLIGSIGVLFGNLIKAAISRQREFLADASAVQFTRNPDGIGGALQKIGQTGSKIDLRDQRHAAELSHMYFSAGIDGLFATHPPIKERIERVMGPGAARLLEARARRSKQPVAERGAAIGATPEGASAMASMAAADAPIPWTPAAKERSATLTPAVALGSAGNVSSTDMRMAHRLLSDLPQAVRDATRTEAGARAALCALMLDRGANETVRGKHRDRIAAAYGMPCADQSVNIAAALAPLGARARLPVFGLCVPTLEFIAQPEREKLLDVIRDLATADERVTLAEFVLLTLCRRHFSKAAWGAPPVKYRRLQDAAAAAAVVLALVARSSRVDSALEARVHAALGIASAPPSTFSIASVEAALYELKLLAPLAKPALIKACLELVLADARVDIAEIELMRAICAALDTPLPPSLGAEDFADSPTRARA